MCQTYCEVRTESHGSYSFKIARLLDKLKLIFHSSSILKVCPVLLTKGYIMKFNRKISTLIVSTTILANTLIGSQEILEPSGLDQIKEIISSDTYIARKVSNEKILLATESIVTMNTLIKEAIKERGLANDGFISVADTRDINDYLSSKYEERWYKLRGISDREDSTAYAIVDNKKVRTDTTILNNRASHIWGRIYNLGFVTQHKNNLVDSIGNKSSSFSSVGYYLGEIIQKDIDSGALYNPDYVEVTGTTGTNLDIIVSTIFNDIGLLRKISTSDMREGASSADAMNHLIIEAIKEEGLANDKKLTTADIRTLNNYLVANHKEEWARLHGDDEEGVETGYHRVQNDGAYTRMFADNVINSIADGIYHLGFQTDNKNRLLNEDGNKNKRFEKVAWWLDSSLKEDLQAGKFVNSEYVEVRGTTGTSLDKIVPYIYNDKGLLLKVSMEDIRVGAASANSMNLLIVEAIKSTGVAADDYISADEVKMLNSYLVENYASIWAELHGDDEEGIETGYHRVQNDGAIGVMHNRNVINNLADGIYHLGFYTENKNRLVNEDGNNNVSFSSVAYWMNNSFKEDYAKGLFK